MRGDADPDPIAEDVVDPGSALLEAAVQMLEPSPEDLEVHGRPQSELVRSDRRCAAEARVADGRDPGAQAIGGAGPRDRDELVPADPRLALDVDEDPLAEVEAVAE